MSLLPRCCKRASAQCPMKAGDDGLQHFGQCPEDLPWQPCLDSENLGCGNNGICRVAAVECSVQVGCTRRAGSNGNRISSQRATSPLGFGRTFALFLSEFERSIRNSDRSLRAICLTRQRFRSGCRNRWLKTTAARWCSASVSAICLVNQMPIWRRRSRPTCRPSRRCRRRSNADRSSVEIFMFLDSYCKKDALGGCITQNTFLQIAKIISPFPSLLRNSWLGRVTPDVRRLPCGSEFSTAGGAAAPLLW